MYIYTTSIYNSVVWHTAQMIDSIIQPGHNKTLNIFTSLCMRKYMCQHRKTSIRLVGDSWYGDVVNPVSFNNCSLDESVEINLVLTKAYRMHN